MSTKAEVFYSAKTAYEDGALVKSYEADRFSSALGRYRYAREQRAVGAILDGLPAGISVLDCPCGIGRWWPLLGRRAASILAMDISEAMLDEARGRAAALDLPVEVRKGDAADLPLEREALDYVFSFALTKHLPMPVQLAVLAEFARVARRGVICTFGLFGPVSYEFWRRRRLVESYPLTLEQLEWMAGEAGLKVERRLPCTTPIGVEHVVLFSKAGA